MGIDGMHKLDFAHIRSQSTAVDGRKARSYL